MPAISTLTLYDRESTPVAHPFTPAGFRNEVAMWKESNGTPVGDNTFTVSSRKTPSGLYKIKMVLAMPTTVTETVNGVDSEKVVRTAYANLEFSFAENSTVQERKNTVGILQDALMSDQSTIVSVIEDLEYLW